MRMLIGKQILLIFLIAFALFTFLPTVQHAAENTAKDPSALNASAASKVPQTANSFGLNSMVHTRWDIHEIMSHAELPSDQFADALIRHLFDWSGKPSEEALDDDLTLIVVDCKNRGNDIA